MKAMVLERLSDVAVNPAPLRLTELPRPVPGDSEVLIKVRTCGVCHTELDEIEGRTPPPRFPVIPGHQVVGTIESLGAGARKYREGDRVGVGWIYSACGACKFCRSDRENLCSGFRATGRDADGGYAEYMTIPEKFAYPIPEAFSDAEAAPLLCAGAIGYRSLRLSGIGDGCRLGLTGFGASAHLVLKMVTHRFPEAEVYVFARSDKERAFARELGAVWTGDTEEECPHKLDSIIDTTPVWKPVVEAMKNLEPGGRLVVNAIRKEDTDKNYLQRCDYATHLWMEKEIKSVANVTRRDVSEFLEIAAGIPIRPEVQEFPLEGANEALVELKGCRVRGAKVLRIG